MFKKHFTFSVGCNVKLRDILTKIYRSWFKDFDFHKMQQYSDKKIMKIVIITCSSVYGVKYLYFINL